VKVVRTIAALYAEKPEGTVGLVPTMGAFHDGHLALFRAARTENDVVIASLFVNPAQFGANEDLASYPRNEQRDARLAEKAGVDVLFAPGADELYPAGFQTWVEVEELSTLLEGEHRPGHFRGVATVVLKLFNIVQPHVAVFGEKDYQQLALIRRMVRDLHLDIDVVGAPIVREADGLAMSSRNRHLDRDERAAATCLARALGAAEECVAAGERDAAAIVAAATAELARELRARVEYVAAVHPETLRPLVRLDEDETTAGDVADRALLALAVWIGPTRLIDNRVLTVPAITCERRSA